jgi:hypothetical protein
MNIESQRRYRTYLLVLVYLITMMEGIAFGVFTFEISPEREALYTLALALVLTQVCIVDSRIVGRPLPLSTYWLVFIFYGIAVPICIIRARGLRGMGYVAAHFAGIILSLILSSLVTGLVCGTIWQA